VFFIYRMGTLFRVEALAAPEPEHVVVRRLYGALFFGAVGRLEALAEALPEGTRVVVLEAHRLVALDTSGVDALAQLHRTLQRRSVTLLLCDLNEQPSSLLERSGLAAVLGDTALAPDLATALQRADLLVHGRDAGA
jgi:SulP family sulfate permease